MKKPERNWKIATINGIEMIVTTLVDGSTFTYPVGEVTSMSEWVHIVMRVEHSRLLELMDATQVLDRRDEHISIQND